MGLSQLLVSPPGTLLEVADDTPSPGALPHINARTAEPFLEVDQTNRNILCVTWALEEGARHRRLTLVEHPNLSTVSGFGHAVSVVIE